MILTVDLGNSNIVFGVFENDNLKKSMRIKTDKNRSSDEYHMSMISLFNTKKIEIEKIEGAIISSVVPSLTQVLSEAIFQIINRYPLIVGPGVKTGLPIRTDNANEVGADLICGSVGAKEKFGYPLLIVDFGTATKIDVIDNNGAFCGCVIAPGLKVSTEALVNVASQLPQINYIAPKKIVGKNTPDSMNSGSVYGHAFMIDSFIENIEKELGYKCGVIATGGLAKQIIPFCHKNIEICEELVLFGLYKIYLKNM